MMNDIILAVAICLCIGFGIYGYLKLNKKFNEFREFTIDRISKLSEKATYLSTEVERISGILEEEGQDEFGENLTKARNKIYSEWLENIVNYNPLKKGSE